jgi:hypothetical protein
MGVKKIVLEEGNGRDVPEVHDEVHLEYDG